jgi:hypothetical protein
MPTLGTQTISSSFGQLIKTFSTSGLDGSLQVITDGDNTSSALSLSTSGVQSTGSFTVSSNSLLLGPVTFGTNLTASTGTATIGTLSVGTQSVGTSTIGISTVSTLTVSTANLPLQLGAVTFGSHVTISTGTATIGTLSNNLATISTATISTMLGAVTYASTITASTGTNTFGTESVNVSTIGTLGVTSTATVGTLRVGAAGPRLTAVSYGTAAFTLSTVQPHNLVDTTTGTFALTGAALGDIVIGSIDSLGSTTGTTQIITSFFPISSNVIRYVVNSKGSTAGTVPAGTIYATAMRFTA